MGSKISNYCQQCFVPDENLCEPLRNVKSTEIVELNTYQNPILAMAEDTIHRSISCDELFVDISNELDLLKSEFLDYFNHPLDHNCCEELVNKDGFKTYGKDLEKGFLLKSEWKIPCSAQEYIDIISNINSRKSWDSNIDEINEIYRNNDDFVITYTKLKKFLAISQRDIVVATKIYKAKNGVLLLSKSCEHPEYPLSKHFVRMNIFLGGYFITDIPGHPEFKGQVFSVTKLDFGGSLPKSMIRKASALALPKMNQAVLNKIKNIL